MKCLEFTNRLNDWLDEQAPGASARPRLDPDALAHLGQCKVCREQFTAAQKMIDGFKLFPRPAPSSNTSQAIVATVLQDREHRRLRLRRRLRLTFALAASILIMVLAGYFFEPGPKKDGEDGPVAKKEIPHPDAPIVKVDAEQPPVAIAQTLDDAKGKVAALTGMLGEQTWDHARQLFAATPTFELPPMGTAILPDETTDATDSLRKAGKEISEGMQPVTRTARRAVDYFMREISTFDVAKID